VLALRHADPPGAVHQPVVLLLPALSASAAQRSLVSSPADRPEPVADARLTAWLHGRVQGVGMRWWIRTRALELGLAGWARNLDDGRVEVVAEGPAQACRELLSALRDSSPPGRVQLVVERWAAAMGIGPGFTER
jgi:acylphosphatase